MKKVALVTGALGGLGTEICKHLDRGGFMVVGTYSGNEEKYEKWQTKMTSEGFKFKVYKCDVSDYESCGMAISKIKDEVGHISVLINNAGVTRDGVFKKMSKESWDTVLRTNLDSLFNMTKYVLDDMIENTWGRIINISSINGQKGQFGQVNYSSAKAGVHGFTMALAQEVAQKGITVNTISPGYMATEMVMSIPEDIRNKIIAKIPVGRLGFPEEIGALVNYLASNIAGFITGSDIAINGGQHMY